MTIVSKFKEAIDKTFSLVAGKLHDIVVTPPKVFVLDAEDSHFNFDRAVLLPDLATTDGSTPVLDARRVTGIGVIYAALVHAQGHPQHGLFVTGHTDAKGAASYNQRLSEQRAQNVSLLLRGKREEWRKLSAKDDNVDDYQTILKWQNQRAGWDCDPGAINNKLNKQTRTAIGNFQDRYNLEVEKAQKDKLDSPFKKKITPDKSVGPETWGAFYDVYLTELMDLLGLDKLSALEQIQGQLKPPSGMTDFVGCGEHIPFNPDRRDPFEKGTSEHLEGPQKNPPDRRVEILFFDPGEEVDLVCHKKPGQCKPDVCPVYNKVPHRQVPIGIPKGLPIAEVNLRLTFVDPEGKVRPFPEELEIEAKFGDPANDPGPDAPGPDPDSASPSTTDTPPSPEPGADPGADPDAESMDVDQEPNEMIGPDGLLRFVIPRKASSLFLRLLPDKRDCITADRKKLDDQKLVTQDEALVAVSDGRVFFRLPGEFNTRQGYFELPEPADGVTFKDGAFSNIDSRATQIGSREKPLELRLNIHWQYFKFEYFDRWTSSMASVPQLRTKNTGGNVAEPLVLEGDSSLVDADAPVVPEALAGWDIAAGKSTLHCLAWVTRALLNPPARDVPDDKCTARFRTKRMFVRTDGDGSSPDAPRALVGFASGDATPDTPGVERVRIYDLPTEWRSRFYPARVEDEARDKIRPFEQVATTKSTLEKPYTVSLDTIVLQGSNARADMTIQWDDTDLAKRFTLFDHQLQVFKPDSTGDPSFTTLKDLKPQPAGPVLTDFPPFTRLIARGAVLYDVFDARTEPRLAFKGAPVGARLAQRLSPGTGKLGAATLRANMYGAPHPNGTQPPFADLGASISAVLRCCGHDKSIEIFHVLQYVAVSFDFPTVISPQLVQAHSLLKNAKPLKARPKNADALAQECLLAIANRWNGHDNVNGAPVVFEVGNPVTARGQYMARLHRSARGAGPPVHGEIRVDILDEVRGFMNGQEGFWDIKSMSPDEDKRFVGAHEFGHIFSLPDEYFEPNFEPSYGQPGIVEEGRSAGIPYGLDFKAMMNDNITARARYFWDLVLFAHANGQFTETKDITVHRGSHKFTTEITLPAKSHVRFPAFDMLDVQFSQVGLCDLFVYITGRDEFTGDEIDGSAKADPYDGIILVRVKMAWDLGATRDHDETKEFMVRANTAINKAFNNPARLAVRAEVGGRRVRLRVVFTPRFICSTVPTGDGADNYMKELSPALASPLANNYPGRVTQLITQHHVHVNVSLGRNSPDVKGPGTPRTAHVRQDGSFLLIFTDSRFDDDVVAIFSQMVGLAGPPKVGADFKPLLKALTMLANPTPEFVR